MLHSATCRKVIEAKGPTGPHLFLGSLCILSFSCQGEFQNGNGSALVQHGIVLVTAHALYACWAAAGGAAVAAPHQLQRFRQQLRE